MLDYQITSYGYYGDLYHYSISRDGKYFTFGITDNLEVFYIQEVNLPLQYGEPQFIGSIALNEHVSFFFDAKSKDLPKGTRALCSVTVDLEQRVFLESQVISTFDSDTKINANFIKSPDEKKIGLTIISDSKKGNTFNYNLVTFDSEMKPVLIEKNISGTFPTPHFYSSSHMNNKGHITVVFAENSGKYSPSSGVEKSHHSAILRTHDGTEINQTVLKLIDRKILDVQPFMNGDEEQLFVTWFYLTKQSKTGFSIIDIKSLEENTIIEFEAKWVEPFIELEINDYVDKTFSNNPKDVLNAHYQLMEIITQDETKTYILEKNTKVEFYAADGGATIVPINNINTTTKLSGDIILIQTDPSGILIDSAKIERNLIHGINSGWIQRYKTDNRCDLIYSNILKNNPTHPVYDVLATSDVTKSQYKGKPENYEFLVSKITLNSLGIDISTETLNQFNLKYKATQFIPYTETCVGESEDFIVVAFVENGLQIIRLLY